MKKQARTKIAVARETMRPLAHGRLVAVAGGSPPPPDSICEPCNPTDRCTVV